MSFTLCGVDVTISHPDGAVWWTCTACDADVELPAVESEGFVVACPDCTGPLHELWRWAPAA